MSMICYMLRFTPTQVDILRTSPEAISDLLHVAIDDERAGRLARLPTNKRAGLQARRGNEEKANEVRAARARLQRFGDLPAALCLEKSWHILHYLFTGDVGPVGGPGDALMMGEDVGNDVGGYGPPRWQSPEEIRAFAQFLNGIVAANLATGLDLKDMSEAGVYGTPMGPGAERELPALRAEIDHYFPRLRDYVETASQNADGLLVWII